MSKRLKKREVISSLWILDRYRMTFRHGEGKREKGHIWLLSVRAKWYTILANQQKV
jgi:hypothetical protein